MGEVHLGQCNLDKTVLPRIDHGFSKDFDSCLAKSNNEGFVAGCQYHTRSGACWSFLQFVEKPEIVDEEYFCFLYRIDFDV